MRCEAFPTSKTPSPLRTPTLRQVFLLLLATFVGIAGPLSSQANTVPPGSLVRWPGEQIEHCALGERQWPARNGACWYPVDLLATGRLELVRWRAGQRESRSIEIASYPYDVQRIEIEDESRVHLSPENLARSQRESARIAQLWPREGTAEFRLPLAPPLAELPEGGRFGARRIINGEPRSPHTGSDFAADTGEPILAVADGEVTIAEEHFFAGNSVFVDHGDGLISMYFHMSRIDVTEGDRVARGQRLGAVGDTGRATGPHLHFGLRWHGFRVDPAVLLGSPDRVPQID